MADKKHPVAQLIEELGQSVGMAVADPKADIYYRPSARDPDDSDYGKTCMSVGSVTEFRGRGHGGNPGKDTTPVTTHTITIVGAPDAADGTPGLKAPNFARLVCRMIEQTIGGGSIPRTVLNDNGDRKFVFRHDDVTSGRSEVEKSLAAVREKLLTPGNEQSLEDFREMLKLAQKVEHSFSDNPKKVNPPTIATRIVPTFRVGDQGVPILGMEIQTNHPAFKKEFMGMQGQGIANTEIHGGFGAFIAGDEHSRYYADGRLIKAEGAKALQIIRTTAEGLIDPDKRRDDPPKKQPPERESSSYGHTA